MNSETFNAKPSPLPWHMELREYSTIDKRGWRCKKKAWFLIDANGRDVWKTKANAELIVRAVNSQGVTE